jgi:hypothetical protein
MGNKKISSQMVGTGADSSRIHRVVVKEAGLTEVDSCRQMEKVWDPVPSRAIALAPGPTG